MLQFSIYRQAYEDDIFWNRYMSLRGKMSSCNGVFDSVLVDEVLNLYETGGKQQRIYSIAAKLMKWGYLSEERFLEVFSGDMRELNTKLSYLEKEDLYNCLSKSICLDAIEVPLREYEVFTQTYEPLQLKQDLQKENYLIYHPRFSGWFSIIENILAADYIAYKHGCNLIIHDTPEWWPYPISFADVYSEVYQCTSRIKIEGKIGMFNFDIMRENFYSIVSPDLNVIEDFHAFKKSKYVNILSAAKNYLNKKSILLPEEKYTAIFLRGGDKLRQESIIISNDLICEDIKNIHDPEKKLYILSDDYNLATNLCDKLNFCPFENLTVPEKRGYDVFQRKDINTVYDILKNYSIISGAEKTIGCPSSNLVNAAHWSNPYDAKYRNKIKTNPVYRYTLI